MILHLHINYDEQNFEFYKENFFFVLIFLGHPKEYAEKLYF